MQDVVIVGAGPTGLWLAGELRLGGASVTVLESRTAIDRHSKALTIHPRTIELFDSRGIAEPFLHEGVAIPNGHFAALPDRMDFGLLDTAHPYTLALPQARTEELLEARARDLGATIRRGSAVTALAPDGANIPADGVGIPGDGLRAGDLADGVQAGDLVGGVRVGAEVVRARYVVGCDGTRSVVRTAAGIDFPGTDATTWGWLGDVTLDRPPRRGVAQFSGPDGGLMVVPLGDGTHRLVGADPATDRPAWPGELTLGELRDTVRRIAGTDFGLRNPVWLSRFGNATRQASAYRRGNVLLAGDAAHMHFPTGGVGMNVGLQDAHNLGWKLAAVVTGRAPATLLDTYHEERHPVGAALLAHTRAQTALMTSYSPDGQALRALLSGLIATTPDLARQLAERLSGLDVTYTTGRRVPDMPLPGGGTLFERLRSGTHVHTSAGLVRPDGHLA
jgi:2-polyprenyl-6-methoxyphenol hydroxylase-like FAD-dependent oxidoreductase